MEAGLGRNKDKEAAWAWRLVYPEPGSTVLADGLDVGVGRSL